MREHETLGIVFSSTNEERISELTEKRTMGSVPIGGRYRLIDFVLSSMVNSGINKVGVVTKFNYQSLMDHLGTGKSWDLAKKRGGLFILPPFFGGSTNGFTNRVRILEAISRFIADSNENYVLLSDCDMVCNIDFKKVINFSVKQDADITLIYKNGKLSKEIDDVTSLSLGSDGRVIDLNVTASSNEECMYTYNTTLIKRELLLKLVKECCAANKTSFRNDLLKNNLSKYKVYGYEFNGYSHIISSPCEYFKANMEFMNPVVMDELFNNQTRPIYTKTRDDMPARYGFDSKVRNSFIANGCVIQGEVENSVLFRGVHVGKGSKISNCVIMQDSNIGENSSLNYVIADKDVIVQNDVNLSANETCPVYISKAAVV